MTSEFKFPLAIQIFFHWHVIAKHKPLVAVKLLCQDWIAYETDVFQKHLKEAEL
jgi:hypothetical protein